MRKLFLLSGLLPCLLLVAGCPKKKDAEADAGGTAATSEPTTSAPTTPAAGPETTAKNKDQVARFPAETKVEDDAAKPLANAIARTSPKGGTVVATLKAGTDIHKVAEYQDCFLVTFPDPKDASSTLLGWIEKSSFTYVAPRDAGAKDGAADAAGTDAAAAPDAGPADAGAPADAGPKCAAGEELVTLAANAAPACKKKCKEDKDCKNAHCLVAKNAAGNALKVCTQD